MVMSCCSSSNIHDHDWMEQSALSWDDDDEVSLSRQNHQDDPSKKKKNASCYWNPDILRHLLCNIDQTIHEVDDDVDGDDDYKSGNDNNRSNISYKSLILLAAKIVEQIIQEYCDVFDAAGSIAKHDNDDHKDPLPQEDVGDNNGIPIAVAIPEGPLLPLAVLVVHALNYYGFVLQNRYKQSTTSKSSSSSSSGADGDDGGRVSARHHRYAILVPLEPREAQERNLHILQDVHPAFVLAVPGKDMDQLQELIDIVNTTNNKKKETDQENNRLMIPIPSDYHSDIDIKLVNFVHLVKTAHQQICNNNINGNNQRLNSDFVDDDGNYTSLLKIVSLILNQDVTSLSSSLNSSLKTQEDKIMLDSIKQTQKQKQHETDKNGSLSRISHIVYTSGTTGRPKGCISSTSSLLQYLSSKNQAHDITDTSRVLLASSLSFDPCFSDILATFHAKATLIITPRSTLLDGLTNVLQRMKVTHVLCTPTLWSLTLLHRHHEHDQSTTTMKNDFPHLQRIALGGEPIPKRLVQVWARSLFGNNGNTDETSSSSSCRLLATYGVTEACVYQTCGEVFYASGNVNKDSLESTFATNKTTSVSTQGQFVGYPLNGMKIRICQEEIQDSLVDVVESDTPGEVVLYGQQVDEHTNYLHRPDLSRKFVSEHVDEDEHCVRYHYRTGDRGILSPDGSLTILGRIVGEEGMIKINGVRVEVGEIEAALVDDGDWTKNKAIMVSHPIVTDSLAQVINYEESQSTIHVYCVMSDIVWKELGVDFKDLSRQNGIVINGGPLWTLLRSRCMNRLKAACIPSAYIAVQQLPLSATGKRDRAGLPPLDSCAFLQQGDHTSTQLKDYGISGAIVAKTIAEFLNLQPCQERMLTKSVSFAMLGGDSLSATVISRTLYAHHHKVENSRFLGGAYGQLAEPFNVVNLLRAKSLGDYVDLLDRNSVCIPVSCHTTVESIEIPFEGFPTTPDPEEQESDEKAALYEALLHAVILGQSSIAIALLSQGADPNYRLHSGRIGKTSGRIEQRATFKSNPLHIACSKGDVDLVRMLLNCDANFKSPNPNGSFPLHLAASGLDREESSPEEALRRLECVKLLLNAGCPLLMRDANKQSILHAAARAGHAEILVFCIDEYQSKCGGGESGPLPPNHFMNWYDHWFRSAVHWATLNGRVQALKVLLEKGCNPMPSQPKTNKHSSMVMETPLEICDRLYSEDTKGKKMERLLTDALRS